MTRSLLAALAGALFIALFPALYRGQIAQETIVQIFVAHSGPITDLSVAWTDGDGRTEPLLPAADRNTTAYLLTKDFAYFFRLPAETRRSGAIVASAPPSWGHIRELRLRGIPATRCGLGCFEVPTGPTFTALIASLLALLLSGGMGLLIWFGLRLSQPIHSENRPLLYALSWGAAFYWALLCALTRYPGYMDVDSFHSWREALSHQYTTSHPPFLAYLMHLSQWFSKNPFWVTLAQGWCFWGGLFLALSALIRSRKLWMLACVAIAFYPRFWFSSTYISKDAWCTGFLLIAAWGFAEATREHSVKKFFVACCMLAAAASARHNAISTVLVPLGFAAVYLVRRTQVGPRGWTAIVFGTLLVGLMPFVLESFPRVNHRDQHAEYGKAVIALGGYIGTLQEAGLSPDQMQRERSRFDRRLGPGFFDELMKLDLFDPPGRLFFVAPYRPGHAGMASVRSFIEQQYRQAIWQYPLPFLRHRAKQFYYFYTQERIEIRTELIPLNDIALRSESYFPRLRETAVEIFDRFHSLRPLQQNSNFLIGIVLVFLAALLSRRGDLASISGVGIAYATFFATADLVPEWRYSLPLHCIGIVLALTFLMRGISVIRAAAQDPSLYSRKNSSTSSACPLADTLG